MNEIFELQPDEKILLEVRKHWFVFLIDAAPTLVLALFIPLFVLVLASFTVFTTSPALGSLPTFLLTLWSIVIWTSLAVIWTDYYLDLWIVTNRRIINMNQIGLFNRETTSWQLDRVQEVTIGVRTIFENFLGFGSVEVQTAGPTDEFAKIMGVKSPSRIQSVIMEELARFTTAQKQGTVANAAAPVKIAPTS